MIYDNIQIIILRNDIITGPLCGVGIEVLSILRDICWSLTLYIIEMTADIFDMT